MASILDHNRIENKAHYVRGMLNLIYSSFGICIYITAHGFLSICSHKLLLNLTFGNIAFKNFSEGLVHHDLD